MFIHSFYYALKTMLRNKSQVFWCLAFPILLGTMFHFAFGGLSADEQFSAIPVAVVLNDTKNNDIITDMLDTLSAPGENQFLDITYTDETEALSLLEQKAIIGILYAEGTLSLTISAEMTDEPINQSILSVFVEQFNMSYEALADIAATHPEALPDAISTIAEDTDYLEEASFTNGDFNESLTYFFNLIAMTCLYAAIVGNNIAIDNQANLSSLGARRSISPVHGLVSVFANLTAALIFEFTSVSVSLCYLHFILSVNFGTQSGYVLFAALIGCLTGISLGFFIGCVGQLRRETKFGILMAVIMIGCLLSGLMVGDIRMYVEKFCPLLNRINPAALISDSLYALTVYPSHERYFTNIATLFLLSLCFSFAGFILVRRKKYASI